jgi:hypothetical protein
MKRFAIMGTRPGDVSAVFATDRVEALAAHVAEGEPIDKVKAEIEADILAGHIPSGADFIGDYEIREIS